ncbi:hypothetical protein DFH09DRAFT_1311805 [Mycena vulgaris]|nr:hypothetical protein DFH09DRAFT_1311805 [Mycena vulgaris]
MEVHTEFLAAGDLSDFHFSYDSRLLINESTESNRFVSNILRGHQTLHYIGMQDANCPWPGIFSFVRSPFDPFQAEFIEAPDVSWLTKDVATTLGDQPALVKRIVDTWVANRPWF